MASVGITAFVKDSDNRPTARIVAHTSQDTYDGFIITEWGNATIYLHFGNKEQAIAFANDILNGIAALNPSGEHPPEYHADELPSDTIGTPTQKNLHVSKGKGDALQG